MLMQDTLHNLDCADTAASFDDALEKAATCGLDVALFDVNEHRKQTFSIGAWQDRPILAQGVRGGGARENASPSYRLVSRPRARLPQF